MTVFLLYTYTVTHGNIGIKCTRTACTYMYVYVDLVTCVCCGGLLRTEFGSGRSGVSVDRERRRQWKYGKKLL